MINDCIIMAGGSGTRLWPASTGSKPKQFLSLPPGYSRRTGKHSSFFGEAIDRALTLTANSPDSRVVIVAGKNHINAIINECAEFNIKERKRLTLIPEPVAKNTAPAIACALFYINQVSAGRERNILVLTADHIIKPINIFIADATAAASMAQADKLVVFGITPIGAETGYGYIETAQALDKNRFNNRRQYEPEIFSVASFHEKPDIKKAKEFIAKKNYYWNSGMFAFSSKFMLAEFHRCSPEVIIPFEKLWAANKASSRVPKGLRILEESAGIEAAYQKTKAISFDYAVAEKCRDTVMVKAGFSWIDVGCWDEYARLADHSDAEVFGTGKEISSCFVDSDIPVALCAVEDLIVVVRSGKDGRSPAVLISKRGETQKVKEIVEKIKASNRTELL